MHSKMECDGGRLSGAKASGSLVIAGKKTKPLNLHQVVKEAANRDVCRFSLTYPCPAAHADHWVALVVGHVGDHGFGREQHSGVSTARCFT